MNFNGLNTCSLHAALPSAAAAAAGSSSFAVADACPPRLISHCRLNTISLPLAPPLLLLLATPTLQWGASRRPQYWKPYACSLHAALPTATAASAAAANIYLVG
jgi:hypothetical protein